ncbi:o-succinylbenzoate--CoA ligase [Saccharothrix algeriensis]|uniref:O-succinylbenzoic acid--CoA ligase n=1 Tax=Saccharothrix algeriensis TaxID=173560 RepID=A0ABS2S8Q0_9PSEU|nr:o-succinylbenzoate--CoA ligase [Saccharothrix algeriensis]MBM7812604.1 O-succinylbenzoic acid--CoA ligase [Saccharothrix algeriensis]
MTTLEDVRRALAPALPAHLAPGDPLPPGRPLVASLPPGRPLPPLRGWEGGAALAVGTSGSTGEPKVVLLPASALVASAELTHARLGGPGTWLLALPTTHIAGVQVLVRSAVAGTEPGVVDLAGGFRAAGFATAARAVLAGPGPRYTALVPTQLARLVATEGPGLAAVREFDAVLVGGAAAPPSLLARARAAGVRVVTTYGMSETSGGCVYDGVPLDGVRVRLVDGRVELAGPVLALGYQGGEPFGEWFRTGDLGRWADGRLEVVGRADDVIVSGGENVSPTEVERVLAAQPGVHEACVVGVPDPEWGQAVAAAVVPADPRTPPDAGALADAVRAAVGRSAAPKRLVFLPELPLRGPGKVDRAAVARSIG